MNHLKELRHNIAASLFMSPCKEEELFDRDFLKDYSIYVVERMIMQLEKEALYYKGDVMYIHKKWAKKNLQEYELDFRTKHEKETAGMTSFARQVLKNQQQ